MQKIVFLIDNVELEKAEPMYEALHALLKKLVNAVGGVMFGVIKEVEDGEEEIAPVPDIQGD